MQVTGDLPRLTGAINSQSGMDFDIVDIKPYLTIGQTSATISAASTQDRYWLGMFATSIATYEPNFTSSTLTAVDVNGPPLLAGDILEYTGTIVNNGNDASLGTVLRIPLPAMVNDVPGSLQIVSGANAGAKTDANDTDQGQYDSATRTIYFNLGTGATGAQGGRMAIGDTAVVRFRVQIMPGFSGILDIQASIGASGELGAPQDQTPTDGNGGDPGAPPTEVIIDECVTNANCSSPEPLCNTAASPKACVQCLANSDCSNPTPYCVLATNTCATCSNPTTEVCDGIDNNCDGQIDEGFTRTTFYRDADGDGFGDPANTVQACTAPAGYVANSLDCNDASAAIKPGVTEICDGIDNNCDGQTDEYLPLNSYYRDADGDGYGNPLQFTQTCSATPPAGYVANSTDCNDADTTRYRNLTGYADADGDTYTAGGVQTVCSGASLPSGYRAAQNGSDCNDSDTARWQNLNGYVDADHDGYGTGTVQVVCSGTSVPTGYSANSTDCEDTNASVHPGVAEVCNGIDDNCAGGIDEGLPLNTYYRDSDGDTCGNAAVTTQTCFATPPAGYVANSTDCNDADTTRYQNLNGYVDADHDGYGTGSVQVVCSGASLPSGYSANSTDCNDADATKYQNLTGYADADGDTYTAGGAQTVCSGASLTAGYRAIQKGEDCNDSSASVHPGATEVCNGIDDNCIGGIDENLGATTCGVGACQVTVQNCVGGVPQTCSPGAPTGADDTCDGIDNNCNGAIDEGYVPVTSCFKPGACAAGNAASSCTAGIETACATGTPAASDDTCDGIDNNCNGAIDEGYVPVTSCFKPGACAAGNAASSCTAGIETACATGTPAASDDTCDGIDNNCNGQTDEGYVPVTSCF